MARYLKSNLPENQTTTLTMVKRNGQQEGKFGPQFMYEFNWAGEMFDHGASMSEEKALQNIPEGTELNVVKEQNQFGNWSLYWSLAGGAKILKSRPMNPDSMPAPSAGYQPSPANPQPPKKDNYRDCAATMGMLLKMYWDLVVRDGIESIGGSEDSQAFRNALSFAKAHCKEFQEAVSEMATEISSSEA